MRTRIRTRSAIVGTLALILLGSTACPTAPTVTTEYTFSGEPIEFELCYKRFGQELLRLNLITANVDVATPIVHAETSTGISVDLSLGDVLKDSGDTPSLKAAGCMTITLTGLVAPSDGDLVVSIVNVGFW